MLIGFIGIVSLYENLRKVIVYIATSADGFIAHADGAVDDTEEFSFGSRVSTDEFGRHSGGIISC